VSGSGELSKISLRVLFTLLFLSPTFSDSVKVPPLLPLRIRSPEAFEALFNFPEFTVGWWFPYSFKPTPPPDRDSPQGRWTGPLENLPLFFRLSPSHPTLPPANAVSNCPFPVSHKLRVAFRRLLRKAETAKVLLTLKNKVLVP